MNNICFYKDVIYYDGNFYVSESEDLIRSVPIHNRFKENTWKPKSITELPENITNISNSNIGVNLVEGFPGNMGHCLWDSMYTDWYGIFSYLENEAIHSSFQWVTTYPLDKIYNAPFDVLETFSGYPIKYISDYSTVPIKIPWLIYGNYGIGIGHVDYSGCSIIKLPQFSHNYDPIEKFVERMYQRYNIVRNKIASKDGKIVWVISKRVQYGFDKIANTFLKNINKKIDFYIIQWEDLSFVEQLKLLNETSILIVGVGTVRANTPFLPNGAVEIQTGDFALWNNASFIQYFDCHIGTLSKFVKVMNVANYTKEECENRTCSSSILYLLEQAYENIPYPVPINREENIPIEVQMLLEEKVKNKELFNNWRNSYSNDISHILY